MFSIICENVPLLYVGFLNRDTRHIIKIMEYLIYSLALHSCAFAVETLSFLIQTKLGEHLPFYWANLQTLYTHF